MVVRVIVNQGSRAPDKLYDYLVPESLEERICCGSRIKVPFGAHNKEVEAYVFELRKRSGAKKLKSVIDVYDRAFDENMLALITWLRDECVCTYLDVIKTVIPSGSINKPDEWVELTADADGDRILQAVADNGGACEVNSLMSLFESDISAKLNAHCKSGALKRVYRDRREIQDRKIRVASAAVGGEELSEAIEELTKRRAHVQARMLEILSTAPVVSLADLVRFSDGSYGGIRALEKKGLIECRDVTVFRNPVKHSAKRDEKKKLTAEQQAAFDEISNALSGGFKEFLLHGVTGSGKTEVFLQAIEECVYLGRKAVMLVPEIALTPQMVARFSARFGERIAVFHSGLSLGERYDEWRRIRDNDADIIIGARSAVFAPADNIGIIIIDEEHEQSYKSEMQPRYTTHDVAKFRAKQYGAVLVNASATPKIESYYEAKRGKTQLLEINHRINENAMPEVTVVDMREELSAGNRSVLSEKLRAEIEENLSRGEQTILFLNRRGFSTFVSCRSCGFVAECPHCSISLTYHKFSDTLRCHYCGHTIKNYIKCPSCGSGFIRYFGGGTQKVEEEIRRIFPDASVLRMDNDTTAGKNAHERLLAEFERSKTDILIGTQMVAKGLDFPNVTLVGVISADTSLHIDDFRSGERTFALLEQVVGRAGRAERIGRAVIQTYSPEHPAVVLAAAHDYRRFYADEILVRRAMWYPPFCTMISVGFSGPSENIVSDCAKRFAKVMSESVSGDVRLIGPIRAALSKIQNKYRWQLIIKVQRAKSLTTALAAATEHCRKNKNFDTVTIVTDKNPNTIY